MSAHSINIRLNKDEKYFLTGMYRKEVIDVQILLF